MNFIAVIVTFICTLFCLGPYATEVDDEAFLAAHNALRAEVGIVEMLSYSPTLAKSAQAWANHLKQSNACQMQHSQSQGRYGENLYWVSALTWSDGRKERLNVQSNQVVDSWSSEKVNFNYASNQCAPEKVCGHYTQIVWRNSKTMGCAMAACDDNKQQVWVCQYQPAGNWLGEKPY